MANSAAEKAYEAAVKEIRRVKQAGETTLDLSDERYRALDRIPKDIATLTALRMLLLNQTAVSDLAPLATLTALQTLYLYETAVSDLTPLAGLAELRHLALDGCQVGDLRPIRGHAKLGTIGPTGLSFQDTPATRVDGTLARLAGIEAPEDRARETLAYLNTLPPWPEPYTPSERQDGQPSQPIGQAEPEVPAPQPAPLQVVEVDGRLRPALPGDGLDDQARLLARQAWDALRDYLADLAPLRPRLDNQMPTLSRALDRFDSALGVDYEALNAIALGIHGSRIMRLAAAASDSLRDADAAEIAAFAAAVALFLDRFSAWRDYRRIEIPEVPSPARLAEALPRIDEIIDDLFHRDAIAADIPEQLKMQEQSVQEAPDDTLAARGLFASFGNVLSALGHVALRAVKALGRGALKQVGDLLEETRKLALKGVAAAAFDIFLTKAAVLNALAAGFPEWFGWITPFLRMLGL